MKDLLARARAAMNLIALLTLLMGWVVMKSTRATTNLLQPEQIATAYVMLFQEIPRLSVSRDSWGPIGLDGHQIWVPSPEDLRRNPLETLDQTIVSLARDVTWDEEGKRPFGGVEPGSSLGLSRGWLETAPAKGEINLDPLRLPPLDVTDAPPTNIAEAIVTGNPDLETCLFAVAWGYRQPNLDWRLVAGIALAKAASIHFREHGAQPGESIDIVHKQSQGTIKVPFIEEEVPTADAIMLLSIGVAFPLIYLLSLASALNGCIDFSKDEEGFNFLFFHPSRIGPALGISWLLLPSGVIALGIYRLGRFSFSWLGTIILATGILVTWRLLMVRRRLRVKRTVTLQAQGRRAQMEHDPSVEEADGLRSLQAGGMEPNEVKLDGSAVQSVGAGEARNP